MTGTILKMLGCAGALAILGGCTTSNLRLSPDYGEAVRQDTMAQVADPDAHYAGTLAPGANGNRAALAQERYLKDRVIEPASTSTSTAAAGGGGASASTQ